LYIDRKDLVMRLPRLVYVLLVGLFSFACGDDGPATTPTPPPTPAASLQLSGQGSFANCSSLVGLCSAFQASLQNVGPGCASGTTVVARFFNASNAQVGSDVQMGAAGASLSGLVIRPQEIVAILSVAPVPFTLTTATRYQLFPTWTNVRC
jgi:hypothetical protein